MSCDVFEIKVKDKESNLETEVGYLDLRNLASDFQEISLHLVEKESNIIKYVYAPSSEIPSDDEIDEYEMDEEEVEYLKIIGTQDYHKVSIVLEEAKSSFELCKSIEDQYFEDGKELFLNDFNILIEKLEFINKQSSETEILLEWQ